MKKFEIEQHVEIKAKSLAYSPYLKKLGRLSGNITSVNRLKDDFFYTVQLDSKSLNKLPEEYIQQNLEDFVESSEINMYAEDLIYKGESDTVSDKDYDDALRRIINIEESFLNSRVEELNYLNSLNDFTEEPDAYEQEMNEYISKFAESHHFKKLTKAQKENAEHIAVALTNMLYIELGVEIGEATVNEVKKIIFKNFAETLAYGENFYKACSPVLIKFFEFLLEEELVDDITEIVSFLKKNAKKIVKEGMDESNWLPVKKIGLLALEAGVDITDIDEFADFIESINNEADLQISENEEPLNFPKIGRNDKITVKYPDGKVLMNVKYKKVMADIEAGKCIVINEHSDN